MESRYEERRRAFKAGSDAAKLRREEALREQVENREDLVNQMRVMAFAENRKDDEVVEVEMTSKKALRKRRKVRRWQYFARQFMIADWFIDVPENFESEWMVYMRPEGDRCMLFSDSGRTVIQRKNGRACKTFFDERFPRGETILDGVLVGNRFVCTDILMWGSVTLLDAEFQCRHFFLQSRLDENSWDKGDFIMSQVDVDFATCERLTLLYTSSQSQSEDWFIPDGFQFIHQAAQYCAGLSPLALVWRDHKISRYAVDTSAANTVPEEEVCVLSLRKKNCLRTEDRHVVAHLRPDQVRSVPPKSLVKCRIVDWSRGHEKKIAVEVIGRAGASRVCADSWSRLLSQHGLRCDHAAGDQRLFDQLIAHLRSDAATSENTSSPPH
eukprot:GEMP01061377.1.p1 GENE.GEMP01061377.1~~GEMP01061377.1.p1  ORF type:complete len:383 (+),score=71.35 GEMP01061377.1:119-1267(+)